MDTKLPQLLAGLALATVIGAPQPAQAEYRDLCDSARVCEYTGPNAPLLDMDVCLDLSGQVMLKGSTACSAGSVPFHARYGEVYDAVLGLVVAYTPLADACTVPGLCETVPGDFAGDMEEEEAICCIGSICWPGSDCGGTLLWCHDGVSNEDGTVTCFVAETL